ncbi:hypothetical protein QTP88_015486 [Uroleucon formosanum]
MKRVYLSGAAKRKAKNNKKLKEEKGKRNLYDLGWCSSSRNLIQNDINEQQCDIDDLEVLENKKEPSIHVGDPKKTQIDDTVVLYPKENTENVINTQNNELVENVQMNENECVKEIDENVIDNNIFCFKGIIEANSNKPSAEMFKLSNDPATWKKLSSSDRDYLAAADNHAEAVGLISWLHSFEFILLTTIWYKVLQCIDDRNKILQSKKLSIDESSMHFQQLATEIQQIKDSWNDLLLESKSVASTLNLTTAFRITSRIRRKKHFHDDVSDERPFHDVENKFKVEVFVTALDRLLSDIFGIQASMEKITNTFSSIISPPDIKEPSAEYLKTQADIISSVYPNDVCANGPQINLPLAPKNLGTALGMEQEKTFGTGGDTSKSYDKSNKNNFKDTF